MSPFFTVWNVGRWAEAWLRLLMKFDDEESKSFILTHVFGDKIKSENNNNSLFFRWTCVGSSFRDLGTFGMVLWVIGSLERQVDHCFISENH